MSESSPEDRPPNSSSTDMSRSPSFSEGHFLPYTPSLSSPPRNSDPTPSVGITSHGEENSHSFENDEDMPDQPAGGDGTQVGPPLGDPTHFAQGNNMVNLLEEHDWGGSIGEVRDGVSLKIQSTQSLIPLGDDLENLFVQLVVHKNQVWRVEGVLEGEHATTVPSTLKFIMYTNVLKDVRLCPAFTFFQD